MKAGEVALTPESEGQLANLRRAMVREPGFALHLVIADGPARVETLARLHAWSGQGGVPVLAFLPGGTDAGRAVMKLVGGEAAPVAGAVIPDGDGMVREEAPLASLNTARDRLPQWIQGPLVILLAPRNEVVLARNAPDLFDVRRGTYSIEALPTYARPEHENFLVQRFAEPAGPAPEEAELRRLENLDEPPLPSALADAWRKLAKEHWRRYDWTGAARAAAEVLRFARPIHYWGAVAEAAWMMGHGLIRTGRLDEASTVLEEAIEAAGYAGDKLRIAAAQGLIADILEARGQLDEALRLRREEELPAYARLGHLGGRASAMGKIAGILEARGQLNEALRIRREEELPVWDQLGDIRARAVTMGKIASILEARGQLDEALRIHREESLPVYDKLGDIRERAVTMVRIASILEARGQLDDALRLYREESLPVVDQLGDIRGHALIMGKIADILQARDQLDEALRIRREEELPVYERLGDIRERVVAMSKIADIFRARGQFGEALRMYREESLPVYDQLGDIHGRAVTMGKIADILQAQGQVEQALHIYREEELPVYDRLGDQRSLSLIRGQIAMALLERDAPGDRDEAAALLALAVQAADEMKIPEAEQFRQIQRNYGL